MPNRILRDGILTSERVNALTCTSEVFYRRLMSVVDDFGRYYALTALLRASLYALRLDKVSEADVEKCLADVVGAGLVDVYRSGSKTYLQLRDFRQQVRAKESKFPAPDERTLSMCASDAKQEISSAHLGGGGGGGEVGGELAPGSSPRPPAKRARKALTDPKPEPPTNMTWAAYSTAYRHRWGADPVRDRAANGMIANLVSRLGAEEAPKVAAFYVQHNDAYYLKQMHPLGLLVRDYQALRAQWVTGRRAPNGNSQRQAEVDAWTSELTGGLLSAHKSPPGGEIIEGAVHERRDHD